MEGAQRGKKEKDDKAFKANHDEIEEDSDAAPLSALNKVFGKASIRRHLDTHLE